MTTAKRWIINMIDRLAERFPHCGFAYGYDLLAEQHVIELSDSETLYTDAFRAAISQGLGQFIDAFPNEAMLFIDAGNALPLKPPILYRIQPTCEAVQGSQHVVGGSPSA